MATRKAPPVTMAPPALPYAWRLFSPIGAYLASGRAASEAEGRTLAGEKLRAMGRKRGSVIVRLGSF
jgi:hypothetical protein